MDALVMCGGRGTRFETASEKPLFEIGGTPMIDRVLAACSDSDVSTVYAAVSPHAPATRKHVGDRGIERIATSGDGYVADLDQALETTVTPVLTVAADLPLLDGELIDRAMAAYDGGSLAVCVPAALKELLGTSLEQTYDRAGRTVVPAGLNVVDGGGGETTHVSYDARLAVNVNRRADACIAERLR